MNLDQVSLGYNNSTTDEKVWVSWGTNHYRNPHHIHSLTSFVPPHKDKQFLEFGTSNVVKGTTNCMPPYSIMAITVSQKNDWFRKYIN